MPRERRVVLTWRGVHLADRSLGQILDQRLLAEAGCSLLEHDVLSWLAVAPEQRLQMLALADRLLVTRSGLTRIVDRIVNRGWVTRERPASNRRSVYAVLTPDGQRALERARGVYHDALNQTLGAHLTGDELVELTRITNKLLDALPTTAAARP